MDAERALITRCLGGDACVIITRITTSIANVRSSSICLSPSPLVIPLLNEQTRVKTKAKQLASIEPSNPLFFSLSQATSHKPQALSAPQREVRYGGRSSRPWNRRRRPSAKQRADHGIQQSKAAYLPRARSRARGAAAVSPSAEMPLPNRKKPRLGRGRTFLHSCCCWCPCVLAGTRQSPARDGTPPSTVPEPRNRSPDSHSVLSIS